MKKLFLSILLLGAISLLTNAQAQTAQTTTSTSAAKDEFWGTRKVEHKGTSADAIGARGANVDKRLNAYEGKKQSGFTKSSFRLKKMKEIEKKEKKMLKKRERDRKRLKKNRN
ncbi:hypothetical protein [Pontibacter sp. SGAir0037]|uniref:hypothetical protein n=1 Tax=Pontibacter sp. SGAir0037 TaxID=2571030 RepID=UPI0010CCC5BC|nr:hypothetical protein [Pontibacter sp. SGAir0037]QCR24421.1 hypothetical protein C1N53_20050 [Pontibacter sp. SGAir0037]